MIRATARWAIILAVVQIACLACAHRAAASVGQESQALIENARDALYILQKPDGTWENRPVQPVGGPAWDEDSGNWGGKTALAVYALLASGESPDEPKLKKAIDFLKASQFIGTYSIAMRCQVWLHLPATPEIRALMRKDADALLDAQVKAGKSEGHFSYVRQDTKDHTGDFDHSNSQYGVLGIWAAEQMGMDIPGSFWSMADAAWRGTQGSDGGWPYKVEGPQDHSTLTMTAAGVASLFICDDYVGATRNLGCSGNFHDVNLDKGLAWIEKCFQTNGRHTIINQSGSWPFYMLYGLERIGAASGYKYFGTTDWFQYGVETLKEQTPGGMSRLTTADLSFSILFLCRGRAPVILNKLQYEIVFSDGKPHVTNWNERPRDVAHLTRWIGKQIERDLNWQNVNLKIAPEELLDAPILYMSGNQALNLSQEDMDKLKTYIEEGGLLVGNADCGNADFSDSFMKLGTAIFPAYKFRELPIDHPIYKSEQFFRQTWKNPPSLMGLSNGARELMILVPKDDLARTWAGRLYPGKDEPMQIGDDIFLYAADKLNLQYKGDTSYVPADPDAKIDTEIKLARIQYKGNWDPEPGGWKRLANIMVRDNGIRLVCTPVHLDAGELHGYRVAHMTGTEAVTLDPKEQAALKDWVNDGGTLIVDSCGGNRAFSDSIEQQLADIFGTRKPPLPVITTTHAVWSTLNHIPHVAYRSPAKKVLGSIDTSLIRVIKMEGRTGVFFSAEDLSEGLVGNSVDGIYGYTPSCAVQIMSNLLAYATR